MKTYQGTETVLGIYDDEYNHSTRGKDILRCTQIIAEMRIVGVVRLGE